MNQIIIPSPDTIPVNWLWFEVLLIVTFFVHMILMNFIVGGSLLTAWDLFRGKLEKKASSSIPTLIALTINFGVPPLLFIQVLYGHFFYTSSVMLAIPWILVIPILILAYYGAYVFAKNMEKAPRWSRAGLLVSSLFLLYIAFIFVNNNTLALTPDRWSIYFDRPGGNSLNLGEPTLLPRFLHFILAALGIGALGRAIFYRFSKVDEQDKQFQVKRNLKIFGWITIVQFAIGTWFWLTMPKEVWKDFMGDNLYATILMGVGWISALLILHSAFTGRFTFSMFLGGLQVLLMILIRDIARRAYLEADFHPRDLEVTPQVSPFIVFLLVFVVGLGALYYMVRLMSHSKSQQS
jgi:hypothetical protein